LLAIGSDYAERLASWGFAVEACGYGLAAWFVFWLFRVLADLAAWRLSESPKSTALSEPAASAPVSASGQRESSKPPEEFDWKRRIKAAQKKKDATTILEVREQLSRTWDAERLRNLDQKLGKWFTRYFQHQMQVGLATLILPELERTAEVFAYMEEFKYFELILPTVRQCAQIKASVEQDETPDE
jgi:hypothetical protein